MGTRSCTSASNIGRCSACKHFLLEHVCVEPAMLETGFALPRCPHCNASLTALAFGREPRTGNRAFWMGPDGKWHDYIPLCHYVIPELKCEVIPTHEDSHAFVRFWKRRGERLYTPRLVVVASRSA